MKLKCEHYYLEEEIEVICSRYEICYIFKFCFYRKLELLIIGTQLKLKIW